MGFATLNPSPSAVLRSRGVELSVKLHLTVAAFSSRPIWLSAACVFSSMTSFRRKMMGFAAVQPILPRCDLFPEISLWLPRLLGL
jgi:polyisoprenoid-binding protein YceI